ncbi:hypothetical protein [Amaricoccus solimangrovi]|uniref:Uncharacterized protein n=1 Tax=Amaricoccus solimangrovi TaxID=2589815 RepID=A0A501WXH7_9RHOB|nr:hypothetical protein [Amaricoccus solimangrovi]TPE52147.1 hypothetical protein FJM51_06895 [Amaricoccus solimangrovi]
MRGSAVILAAVAFAAAPALAQQVGAPLPEADSGAALVNDYPTEARADYVFVCMATNGQTREALRRCSCSIDVIASIIPYEKYVDAETVLAMRQVAGERVGMMRTAPVANDFVRDLKRAQAEGDVRCF